MDENTRRCCQAFGLHSEKERERDPSRARESRGREKSRDRERESRNCSDQRLYHPFLCRRTENWENFEPFRAISHQKQSIKFCEEKPEGSRKNCLRGRENREILLSGVILVVFLCGYDGEGRGECSSSSSSDQTWKCEVVFEGGLRSSGSEPAGVATSVKGQRSRGMFAQARHLLRALAACVPYAQAVGRS